MAGRLLHVDGGDPVNIPPIPFPPVTDCPDCHTQACDDCTDHARTEWENELREDEGRDGGWVE